MQEDLCGRCIHINASGNYCEKRKDFLKAIILHCPFYKESEKRTERVFHRGEAFKELNQTYNIQEPQNGEKKVQMTHHEGGFALFFIDHIKIIFLLFLIISCINITRILYVCLCACATTLIREECQKIGIASKR